MLSQVAKHRKVLQRNSASLFPHNMDFGCYKYLVCLINNYNNVCCLGSSNFSLHFKALDANLWAQIS